ncbi:MAG: polymer-forming cytoskeletal protein [Ruminococcus flavefaciens]|nr:polymer-forming cytoskeletal protein [Ruminococcus flavefaciens]MCM1229384.1 polymer-forming cytoskeletal protein [Ruminococcus flavefaciens]
MIKKEKKRRLHGSVLLTVVCVMSILIVFLFGTLALATAANNRAHVNYSTAQTEVTSRTVVDAAIKAMVASPDYANAVSTVDSTGIRVNVQLDGSTVPNVGKYGDIEPVEIKPVGKKKFYDADKKEWIDGDILKFTSVVSMAGVDSTTSAYIVKQPPTKDKGNGGGGAGFVTTAGAELTCQTNLYGGTYINVPELGEDKNSNGTFDTNDVEGAVFYDYTYRTSDEYKYNWNKKTLDGSDLPNPNYDLTLYRQFAPYGAEGDTTFILDNYGAIAEADLYVNNNMLVDDWKGFIFPEEGKGITVWGDLGFENGGQSYTSNLKSSTPEETTTLDFNKIPYIYVDGKISQKSSTSVYLGDDLDPFPLNIFCGSIDTCEATIANKCYIGGDIYCMNPNETSRIGGNTGSKLYAWSASVVNKAKSGAVESHTTASIYSLNKELILLNMSVSGDVRADKDCTIEGTTTIDGDLVVGGNLKIDGNVTVNGDVIVKGELKINSGKLKLKKDSKIYCDSSKATGLDSGVEADPKYVEHSTFLHNASEYPNAEEVTNGKRYYLEYKAQPKPGEDPNQQYGLLDEPAVWHANNVTYYYKWKDDFNPIAIFGTDDPSYYCNPVNFTNSGLDIADYIEPGYQKDNWNDHRPHNPADNAIEYYYVETVWDDTWGYVTKSVPTDKEKYYVDPTNNHEVIKDFRTVPDADGNDKFADSHSKQDTMAEFAASFGSGYDENSTSVWFEIETRYPVSPATANPGSVTTYAVPDDLVIYPEYAEREVILGLKKVGTTSIEETKIVKTFKEVLEDVANPYKEGKLSTQLSAQHEELYKKVGTENESQVYFSNIQQVFNAQKDKLGYATNIQSNGSYKYSKDDWDNEINKEKLGVGAIITDDCILDNVKVNGGYLIFEPGTKDILVIVKNITFSNDASIIVNDSEGGSVNFYIEENGKMILDNNNWVAPTSYMKALADETSGIISYGNVDMGGLNLNKLGKPHINIYGGHNSVIDTTNAQGFIANIVSSELRFKITAGSKMPCASKIEHIYYNGNELSNSNNPFIIGCVNSSYADVPERLNVLFVTDPDSDDDDFVGDGENAFNYRILYYDEY